MQFLDIVVGFSGAVYGLYVEVGNRVVREVKVFGDVDWVIVKYVCAMVVDSCIELLCGVSYILFLAFDACNEVDDVCCGAGKWVADVVDSAYFRVGRSECG